MTQQALTTICQILGEKYVLRGAEAKPWSQDWSGSVRWSPLAVLRPANTAQVSEVLQVASEHELPVVPVSGNTGLTNGTEAENALMLSLDRLNTIREVRPQARIAIVEAGVILAQLHEAVDAHDLVFPLTFGARGSAMIGGALSTNAGGSNVVRYGSTRGLCLGIEAVLADGRILNLMSGVHKDNSGYDLRDLLIGAEGTLGIITAAVLKLAPKPRAYLTAMVACRSIDDAVSLLNRLQMESGGAVEAFEYLPENYIAAHMERFPGVRAPFEQRYEVNVFVEIGAVSKAQAMEDATGRISVAADLENTLEDFFADGCVLDAVIAQNEAQRREMWDRREAAAEISRLHSPIVDNDIAVPVDQMQTLIERIEKRARDLDPGVQFLNVAHLGDGNLHFAAWPSTEEKETHEAIKRAVEEETIALGGSFSAEHGVGLLKRQAMALHKDPVAVDVMRAIKKSLDPKNILNPGKVLP